MRKNISLKKIQKLLDKHMTQKEIGVNLGCSRQWVNGLVKKHKLKKSYVVFTMKKRVSRVVDKSLVSTK
jgi:DNA-binding transcriptional regulator LsrR (DeoR family)